jgi:hypothetical protein
LKAIDATLLPVKKFLSRAEALQEERKLVEKASKGTLPLNNEPWSPNKRCR